MHKKRNKQTVSNYRPVSLLPIIRNIFERSILNFKNLNENNLLLENHQENITFFPFASQIHHKDLFGCQTCSKIERGFVTFSSVSLCHSIKVTFDGSL